MPSLFSSLKRNVTRQQQNGASSVSNIQPSRNNSANRAGRSSPRAETSQPIDSMEIGESSTKPIENVTVGQVLVGAAGFTGPGYSNMSGNPNATQPSTYKPLGAIVPELLVSAASNKQLAEYEEKIVGTESTKKKEKETKVTVGQVLVSAAGFTGPGYSNMSGNPNATQLSTYKPLGAIVPELLVSAANNSVEAETNSTVPVNTLDKRPA